MELSLAYLSAAGLIATLFLLARRNRKQGWRKPRPVWSELQAIAAVRAFEAKGDPSRPIETLQHLGDLDRLRQSLVAHGKPQPPEALEVPVKTPKKDTLAPAR